MREVSEEDGFDNLALAQSYNTLWALCTGNGQNAEVVHGTPGFMEALPKVLEQSNSEAVVLACVGISGSVCVKSPERRETMAKVGVPEKLLAVLKRFGYHPHIIIQVAIVMMDLAQSDKWEAHFAQNGTLKCLIESWRDYHLENRVVSYTIPDKLYNFTFGQKSTLIACNTGDLARKCLERFPDCVPMQKFCNDLLGRL